MTTTQQSRGEKAPNLTAIHHGIPLPSFASAKAHLNCFRKSPPPPPPTAVDSTHFIRLRCRNLIIEYMPSRSLSQPTVNLDVLAAAAAAVTVAKLLTAFLPHLHTFLHTPSSSSFATYLSPPLFFFAHTSPALRIHTICFQISKISAFNCPTCSLAATFCHATSFLHTVLFFLCSSRTTPRAGATF